ncbi:auxin-responsive protein SAUR21-like [Gastrolobium bilobum]|uniref:auxin-responsive protein SAUR21-like n=1 Tax=Gastrolobium bilobum TaxID=150636 RepID=UPI002AB2AF6E|nr:auxin-responsive protein SAUR21-like [Gastrolobium bilobum]
MAIRLPSIMHAKHILCRSLLSGKRVSANIPKGYFAVYVGEEKKKRFVVPISYLHEPAFQQLLSKVEEEFGYNHPMGGLTIPCREDIFFSVTSQLEI